MKKIAVIYKSYYGTTKCYAGWIAEELNADLLEQKNVSPADLQTYDLVIYGGGIYASGILGIELLKKAPIKNLIVFTVGLANPESTDYTEIIQKNLSSELCKKAKIFHLRGGMNYKKLKMMHHAMMAMRKKMITNKKAEELTQEDQDFLETYNGNVNFIDRAAIAPVIEQAQL